MSQENVEVVRRAFEVIRDAVLRLARSWTETFDELVFEAEEIIDADDDRVVVITRVRGIGQESRAPVEVSYGAVDTLEGGRIVRWELFPKPSQALGAVQ